MFTKARKRTFITLFLMSFLVFGAASAQAGTHGSDRVVKGAVAGAIIGAFSQAARGRTTGGEVLRGAAVGSAVGAAVGALSDHRNDRYRRDRYRYDSYGRYRDYDRPVYRTSRPAYRTPYYDRGGYYDRGYSDRDYYRNSRGNHRHRCH